MDLSGQLATCAKRNNSPMRLMKRARERLSVPHVGMPACGDHCWAWKRAFDGGMFEPRTGAQVYPRHQKGKTAAGERGAGVRWLQWASARRKIC